MSLGAMQGGTGLSASRDRFVRLDLIHCQSACEPDWCHLVRFCRRRDRPLCGDCIFDSAIEDKRLTMSTSPLKARSASRATPPLERKTPIPVVPFAIASLHPQAFANLTAYLAAFDVARLWMTGVKKLQELMIDVKGGATHFRLYWQKPVPLPWPTLLSKLITITDLEIIVDSLPDAPIGLKQPLHGEMLPRSLKRLTVSFPRCMTELCLLSGPQYKLDERRYAKQSTYFDFAKYLPNLTSLSMIDENSAQDTKIATGSERTEREEAARLASALPRTLTSLTVSPFPLLSEAFVEALPPSLTQFSQNYRTLSHEEPINDWRQRFGAALGSLTIKSPIADIWRFLPKNLTYLDLSQCDINLEPAAWKHLPRSLTYLGLPEFSGQEIDDVSALPPKLLHLYTPSKFDVSVNLVRHLPPSITHLSHQAQFSADCLQYLNPDFEHISVAPAIGKEPHPLSNLPVHLHSLEIRGNYTLDFTQNPLKQLYSLRLLHGWSPAIFDYSSLPNSLRTLQIDSSCTILQYSQIGLLPKSLQELDLPFNLGNHSVCSFDAFPQYLISLKVEVLLPKKKKLAMPSSKVRLSRNVPCHLQTLEISGKYKLFTNEWVEALPPSITQLHIRPRKYSGDKPTDILDSKLTSNCFPNLPPRLKVLSMCIDDVLNDSALAKLPRSLARLTIEKAPPSVSILSEGYLSSLPPNITALVLPQSKSLEYIPLSPYSSPKPQRRRG